MSMRIVALAVAMLCAALVFASDAAGQSQRLYAIAGSRIVEVATDPPRLGRILRSWDVPSRLGPGPILSSVDGRYLVWAAGQFSTFDTVTGRVSTPSLSPDIASVEIVAVTNGGEVVLSARTTDFSNRLIVWNPSGAVVRSIPLSCPRQFAYAPGSHQVLVLTSASCAFGYPPPQWIDVVNLHDGTIRSRAVDVPFTTLVGIATDRFASRLWMVAVAGYGDAAGYGLYDVATGALRAANTSVRAEQRNRFTAPKLIIDEARNLVLTVTTDGLAALDANTLSPLARMNAPAFRLDDRTLPPGYTGTFSYAVLADPAASASFVYEASGMTYSYHGGPCLSSSLIALNPVTGARTATRNLAEIAGTPLCHLQFAMTVSPPAPHGFRADVAGRQVTFTWEAPPQATHYELEVGTAPGLRNLGVLRPDSLPFVVNDVPPGTYHVRLRALNYAGKGAYTSDLLVTVR